MKFLSQRIKFKAQYNPNSEQNQRKKSLSALTIHKQKSLKVEDEKKIFPTSLETQTELLQYKDSIFRDVPMLALSVEQFGTLEVIEDYLLNKLNSKEDLQGGLFGRSKTIIILNFTYNDPLDLNDLITEKFDSHHEPGSDEDFSPNERLPSDTNISEPEAVNQVPVIK